MKHKLLRRLGALLLSLALAVPLAVAPALAAPTSMSVTLSEQSLELTIGGTTETLTANVLGAPSGGSLTFQWRCEDKNEVEITNDPPVRITPNGDTATIEALAATTDDVYIRVTANWQSDDPTSTDTESSYARCLVTISAAVTPPAPDPVSVALSESALTLEVGQERTLTATVTPDTAADKTVTWSSSSESVAHVDRNGKVTAIGPGPATITATSNQDPTKKAECAVTVTRPAYGIEFNISDTTDVQMGGDGKPTVQFNGTQRTKTAFVTVTAPAGFSYEVRWENSDPAAVSMGSMGSGVELILPTTRKPGEYTVTAALYDRSTGEPVRNADGSPIQEELKVIVSGIVLSATSLEMFEGAARTLSIAHSYGEAASTSALVNARWTSSDPSVVAVENGSLIAWGQGTVTITASVGDYSAACVVNVVEDNGTYVNVGTTTAGNPISMTAGTVVGQLNKIAQDRTETKANMTYVTGLYVSPAQGIVHNNHRSEDDTGAGVSMAERYTVSGTGADSLSALSFVPSRNFSGTARISYSGWADGQVITGVFLVQVNPMGDVTYSSVGGAPVTFQSIDFNTISNSKTGHDVQYVTFTPPSPYAGTLYYHYTNASHPGQAVNSSTQYRLRGTPSLDEVTFVPSDGYSGTVRIPYRAVDTANTSFSGTVIITVTKQGIGADSANVYLSLEKGEQAKLKNSDFSTACWNSIGETLSHVRFTLPERSEGTLFYNYRSFSSYDSMVSAGTNYYRTGNPALDNVSFVPITTTPSRVSISYTGYGVSGRAFTGTVYISYDQVAETGIIYTAYSGDVVSFLPNDFNKACLTATNNSLSHVVFNDMPSESQGNVYYSYRSDGTYDAPAYAGETYYRTGSTSQKLIGSLTFQADGSFSGILRIPYTGYSTAGDSFQDEVVIQVNAPASGSIIYTASGASPIRLSASRVRSACRELLQGDVYYITFTDLPDPSSGRMYLNYSGFDPGTAAQAGVKYYLAGIPSIEQISFVPRGRFEGEASVGYTAWSSSGEQVSGKITFNIIRPAASIYFTDMGGHLWAAAAADYLSQNRVTNGVTTTTYGPEEPILRRDFVVMLHRALGFQGNGSYSFADVPTNEYYSQAVAAAKQNGIVSGYNGSFAPATPITRQDAMVVIKNAMSATGRDLGTASTAILSRFPDGGDVDSYARDAVSILVQLGAIQGDEKGMLNPRAYITRAEAAVILHFVMTL